MTRKERRKSTALCLVVILTCLVQTIDCNRLKKTHREGRRESGTATTKTLQPGKIVFGKIFVKGVGIQSQKASDVTKKSSTDTLEDDAAYQADSPVWPNSPKHGGHNPEAAWKRMAPSLQCGGDQLKFRVLGPGVSQLSVLQGSTSAIPLSQVPSNCGYNMHRNSLALMLQVPYDGCNVVQEGGNYVLPLQWQGIPVSLWCSKPASPPCATTAPLTAEPQTSGPLPSTNPANPTNPPVPQKNQEHYPKLPPNFFFPPQLPQYPTLPPKHPITEEPTAQMTQVPKATDDPTMAKKPHIPQMPFFLPPLPPYFTPPPMFLPFFTTPAPAPTESTTTPMPTTATPAATGPPQNLQFPSHALNPFMFSGPMQFSWFPNPADKNGQTNSVKPQLPFEPKVPFWFQYPVHPPQYPQPPPQYPQPPPQYPQPPPQYPQHPQPPPQHPQHPVPVDPVPVTTPAPAPTTTTMAPAPKYTAVPFPHQYFHHGNPFQFMPYHSS